MGNRTRETESYNDNYKEKNITLHMYTVYCIDGFIIVILL